MVHTRTHCYQLMQLFPLWVPWGEGERELVNIEMKKVATGHL
jgi:hypothetical protein